MRLAGKVALITGAAAGIGRASALLFAREGAGVVVVDLDGETGQRLAGEIRETGGRAIFHQADVSQPADARAMIGAAEAEFGRLDVLFNNAGIVPQGTVEETDEADWDRAMAINVRSAFLGCKYAIPLMLRGGGGSIIQTASVAGLVGVKSRASYSASKMALIGLTRSVALDYIDRGIRANAICPGTVDTPSWRQRVASAGDPEAARAAFVARQPMGRLGTPEEIAHLALYLASDESAYMTGSEVIIDGGLAL